MSLFPPIVAVVAVLPALSIRHLPSLPLAASSQPPRSATGRWVSSEEPSSSMIEEILPPMRQPSTPLEDWHDATGSPSAYVTLETVPGTRDHPSWLPLANPASQFSRRENCNDADRLL